MSIWPFFIGHFVELPYTLAQDCTLTNVLGETTPRLWLEKIAFIKNHYGMALINTHPDYIQNTDAFKLYCELLKIMKEETKCWHALPQEVASWWKTRAESAYQNKSSTVEYITAFLKDGKLNFDF